MPSVDLTIGEQDFTIEFDLINETTNGPFDLTNFDSRLYIKTTNFVTDIVPGGIAILPLGNPQDGVLLWNVQASHIPSLAGQYYGMIVMSNLINSEIRKSRRFNIRVERKLD